jgi:nucleoside-diphosphate-sugar epimerase
LNKVLIIGCGDIGKRVAALALEQGAQVAALTRSPEHAERLSSLGIKPVIGDLDGNIPIASLPTRGATIFYLAPPPGGGDIDPRVRVFGASVEPGEEPDRLIYVSTTGVYGDCGGALVDEETPVNSLTTRARRRIDAERLLLAWGEGRGIPVIILRVAGIYGPGRLPLDKLRAGQPVLRQAEAPGSNRIHADDLARVCLAAAERAAAGAVYNVCDGEEGTMTDYFNAVAAAYGLPAPPQVSREEAREVMNPLLFSYYSESRRIDNRRMREELKVELRYPTLAAGLAAIRDQE